MFLGNKEHVKFLTSSDREYSLLGPLSARFQNASSIATDCFVLSVSQVDKAYDEIVALCKESSCDYSALFLRQYEILIAMSAKSSTAIRPFISKLLMLDSINSCSPVTIGDHRCLTMYWNSRIPVDEIVRRLERSGTHLIISKLGTYYIVAKDILSSFTQFRTIVNKRATWSLQPLGATGLHCFSAGNSRRKRSLLQCIDQLPKNCARLLHRNRR